MVWRRSTGSGASVLVTERSAAGVGVAVWAAAGAPWRASARAATQRVHRVRRTLSRTTILLLLAPVLLHRVVSPLVRAAWRRRARVRPRAGRRAARGWPWREDTIERVRTA